MPTLCLAYSAKAEGICLDFFGNRDLCLDPCELSPDCVAEKMEHMLERTDEIRSEIGSRLPRLKERAMNAGRYLREVLEAI